MPTGCALLLFRGKDVGGGEVGGSECLPKLLPEGFVKLEVLTLPSPPGARYVSPRRAQVRTSRNTLPAALVALAHESPLVPKLPKLTPVTDRELVDRARSGDSGAFGQLVRKHQRRIQRLALHLLRSHAEAEDVAQGTFIRAYRALAQFDGRSEPYTWFYRIAINLSLNVLRSRKAQRTTSADDDPRLNALIASRHATDDPPADAARRQLYAGARSGHRRAFGHSAHNTRARLRRRSFPRRGCRYLGCTRRDYRLENSRSSTQA